MAPNCLHERVLSTKNSEFSSMAFPTYYGTKPLGWS